MRLDLCVWSTDYALAFELKGTRSPCHELQVARCVLDAVIEINDSDGNEASEAAERCERAAF